MEDLIETLAVNGKKMLIIVGIAFVIISGLLLPIML